ncbi:uncharacterized protein C20orf96 homolog isoform X2 [Equus quagga]|uniref:uncharacterized protein C20orf96 homolog isoform X2 n=1 Tax=Equus quagga TaxID=89248 RepID=UPI001EE37CBF|nr:uncharacterized protein C20orf96 homolog isoform X2 [Equus quagga]
MARVFAKPDHSGIPSTMQKFQILDYDPWQRSKQRTKSSTLPPVVQTSGQKKSKMKTLTSVQPGLYSKPTMLMTSQPRNPQDLRRGKLDSGKTQASIRLMKMMLRNRRTSLQELRSHENFLTRLNGELGRNIQDMEDSAAQKVRAMLQQQDIFATVMDILEYSNKKKLQQMKCELQEWQEKEEAKMRHLERQVEQLNARIRKTKEEVSFLSTYMDHEKVLESLSNKIQKKKRKLLRSLVVKTQSPYEEALLQKTRDSQDILKCTGRFREFIKHFEEEIPILRAEVQQLQVQLQEPRDIIFADVLLRRPKCTPDMDVILNIPVEELLPF